MAQPYVQDLLCAALHITVGRPVRAPFSMLIQSRLKLVDHR